MKIILTLREIKNTILGIRISVLILSRNATFNGKTGPDTMELIMINGETAT